MESGPLPLPASAALARPLVDDRHATDMLDHADPDQQDAMRAIYDEMLGDVQPWLQRLAAGAVPANQAPHDLHQIKGNLASFALARAAALVAAAELHWAGWLPGERQTVIQAALDATGQGDALLRQRFGYLSSHR